MTRSELERELERLHAECWGWALACCGRDRELAEEALQTAYVRILSGRATFRGRSSVKTWVFGVIRFTSMEETRQRAVRRSGDAEGSQAIDVPDPALTPDSAVEFSERDAALADALATLSPRQREV